MPTGGGGSVTLAEDSHPIYIAGAWLADGTIVYVSRDLRLRRVPAEGGPA